jgi:outer membrane receptor protein involved in Fe transport
MSYRHKQWLAQLRINNLTDRKYSDYAATAFNPASFATETAFYAAPERNLRATLQYTW